MMKTFSEVRSMILRILAIHISVHASLLNVEGYAWLAVSNLVKRISDAQENSNISELVLENQAIPNSINQN